MISLYSTCFRLNVINNYVSSFFVIYIYTCRARVCVCVCFAVGVRYIIYKDFFLLCRTQASQLPRTHTHALGSDSAPAPDFGSTSFNSRPSVLRVSLVGVLSIEYTF